MLMEKLEQEIAAQNSWDQKLQKEFIKDCLRAQGDFKRVKSKNVDAVFQAYTEKALGDESIQYYVRVYLEMVYQIY